MDLTVPLDTKGVVSQCSIGHAWDEFGPKETFSVEIPRIWGCWLIGGYVRRMDIRLSRMKYRIRSYLPSPVI